LSQLQPPMVPCPPHDLRPILLQRLSTMCRAARGQASAHDVRGHGVVGAAWQIGAARRPASGCSQSHRCHHRGCGPRDAASRGGEAQWGELPLLVAAERAQELAGILHAGGGRGDHRHPAAVSAAVAGGQDLSLQCQGAVPGRRAPAAPAAPAHRRRVWSPASRAAVRIVVVDLVVAHRPLRAHPDAAVQASPARRQARRAIAAA
jgi:hypothetical protein